ncbi:GTP-binding protein [Rugosimonospora acidiphila]|uniref:GTP-binding protein n=1 Tax=Rugosimonospora acidiphila TaxID=556531 RepID=A0ABP9S126_9ACTN
MSSPIAPARAGRTTAEIRPAVTVLSGFWPEATAAVTDALLASRPALLCVEHDLTGMAAGAVRRVVRTGAEVLEDVTVELVHGCVSCTLREDVLPTLVRLAATHPDHDQLLVLPRSIEPETLQAACAYCLVDGAPVADSVRFDSYLTVVHGRRLLDDLTSTDDLADRGLQAADDDHRAVADLVAHQIESADTLALFWHTADEDFDRVRLSVLLHRLAPWATQHQVTGGAPGRLPAVGHTHRYDPETPGILARGIEGHLVGVHEPVPDCGLVSVVFRARRPFHPRRLDAALRGLTVPTLRSRGHLWLASQPDTVVAWEGAGGGLGLGSLGRWLAAVPDEDWSEASDQRRVTAAAGWDPYYGDRDTHLVFIGIGLDAATVHRTLVGCLLTDAELSLGESRWRTFDDPFAGCFADDEAPDPPGAAQ